MLVVTLVITVYALLIAGAVIAILLGFTDVHFHRRRKPGRIHVACIGDSITNGDWIPNCFARSYPSVLQKLLGKDYQVENYGLNDRTVMRISMVPFTYEPECIRSRQYLPEIVIILLGSNDSRSQNWVNKQEFKEEYRRLVQKYQELPENPRIILCTPPRVFQIGIPELIKPEILSIVAEAVRETAAELSLELVDLQEASRDWNTLYALDGLHPDVNGARKIAGLVAEAILAGNRPAETGKTAEAQA